MMDNVVQMITQEQQDRLDRAREWAELEAEIRKPGKVYVSARLFAEGELIWVEVVKKDLLAELHKEPHEQVVTWTRQGGNLYMN